ncbi:large ribosomal subunit protein mL65 isoform X3 [Eschrichtius robustus]|uniref:large ribosomal subunit protein mL65 isoform X3 n=1 Tax=Eschrichtius robustus TaxID=9764 RepID=UPI0035BEE22F
MAAARCWRLVLRGPGLSLHTAAGAAVTAPEVTGPDVAAAPVARYPPLVASLTADSKAARQRRVERWQATVHAAKSVDEKLRILTKMQFMKYVVYPQTFALNADRWYQSFTKTVFLSGLPPPPPPAKPDTEPAPALDVAALRAAACDCLLQEHFFLRRKKRVPLYLEREAIASPFLDQLVASLTGLLSARNPALAAAALDCKRPVHFYWLRGEEIIPRGHRKGRVDALRYQINDKPHNQIRISKQLPEFVPLDYSVPVEVPVMNCKPDKLPLFKRQYENTIFIGTKTADPHCYGHTQFHLLPDKLKRERLLKQNCANQIEVVFRANAIASLFAWTGAQAMYQATIYAMKWMEKRSNKNPRVRSKSSENEMPDVEYCHVRNKVNSSKKNTGNQFCPSPALQSLHERTSLGHDVDERYTYGLESANDGILLKNLPLQA